MSLKNKFKTDPAAANDGAWFHVTINSDGTECRVCLARSSDQNKDYTKSVRAMAQKLGINGTDDASKVSEDLAKREMLNTFLETILKGWEHLQLEDNGEEVPYNSENARAILSDPAWVELYNDWREKSNDVEGYRARENDKSVKN